MKTPFRARPAVRWSRLLPAGLLLLALPVAAQTLTNNGAALTVQPGTVLFVGGGLLNQAGGTIANHGTVALTGNFTLTGGSSVTGTGPLRFVGNQDQTLSAPTGTSLTSVEHASTGSAGNNRLLVPNNLTISDQLALSGGLVRTAPAATISLPDGATLSGETAGRYVQGHLKITRNVVAGLVDFGHGVLLDGSDQNLGAVTITRSAGLNTADATYGANLGATTQGIDRIWTVMPTNQPTAPVPLTVNWLSDDDHGLNDFSQAQLWQQPAAGSPWMAVGAAGSAAGRSLTRNPAVLGRFTISNGANPLPVELISFTAERQGAGAQLRWATASERNNAHFVVESSADGRSFSRLGQLAGHGSSSQPQTYEFRDPDLARYAAAVVYYRLRQVDADATESLSSIRSLAVSALTEHLTAKAYPVPLRAGEPLSLHIGEATSGLAELYVTDASGRAVLRQALALPLGTTDLALPEAARWPPGLYLLRVTQGAQQHTVKVVRE